MDDMMDNMMMGYYNGTADDLPELVLSADEARVHMNASRPRLPMIMVC